MINSKKVLIVSGSYKSGGAEKVSISLANKMAEFGYDTYLIVILNKGPYRKLVSKNVKLIDLNSKKVFLSIFKLFFHIINIKPFSVLSTQRSINNYVIILSKLAFVKNVFIREATTFDNIKYRNPIYKIIYKFFISCIYSLSDGVICNSKFTLEDVKKNLFVKNTSLYVIPNPIIDECPYKNTNLSSKNDISLLVDKKSYLNKFVCVGRLEKLKNFDFVVDVFHILSKKYNVSLDIWGEGSEQQYLQDKINKLGISNIVKLKGFCLNINDKFVDYDCLILPSKWEGFGNVIVEAGSKGCSIIGSNAPGGISEILEKGRFGQIFQLNKKESLTSCIINVIDKKVIFTPSFVIQNFANKYSVNTVTEKYLTTIRLK